LNAGLIQRPNYDQNDIPAEYHFDHDLASKLILHLSFYHFESLVFFRF